MKNCKVSVIGLGYVGLPTAAILASRGFEVIGVDVRDEAINIINNGYSHIIEPDLDTIVNSVVHLGKLKAVHKIQPADIFIIAVPSPLKEDKTPDLSYIQSCIEPIAKVLQPNNLVILESTSPIGTTENLSKWLAEKRSDLKFPHNNEEADIAIAHCPERILPGSVIRELVQNDRIIGGITPNCSKKAAELYESFVIGKLYLTTARTAEMVKLTENAFRDVNIAFANELSMLCDHYNINAKELIELTNKHPRVNILSPGPGVGGHCIAVDPWFLIDGAPEITKLIRSARDVNDSKINYVTDKISKAMQNSAKPVLSCFGLAYKPDVDDLRESPAQKIVEHIAANHEIEILVVEPYINELPNCLKQFPHVRLATVEDGLKNANIITLLVDHSQFKKISRARLSNKIIIDTKNIWDVRDAYQFL